MTSLSTVSATLRVSGELDVVALAEATHELAVRDTTTTAATEPTFVDRSDRRGRRPGELLHDLIDAPWPEPQRPWRIFVVLLAAAEHVILLCANPVTGADPQTLLDELAVRYHRASARAASTLPELVEAQVARTPQAPALRWADGELTYAELNRRANRLAHALIARGAGPGQTVALLLPRSPELVVATVAVTKTGAAFLPIDPAYPAARISQLIDDARPLFVLGPDDLVANSAEHDPRDADRTAPLRAANVAYVIYTSGTTGKPKGVLVPHTGLRAFTTHQAARTGVGPGDRVLQYASPSFDASILELLLALPTGACLVTPEPGPLLGATLAETLRRERITHTLIPPAALATIPTDAPALPELRHLIVGGDATTADLVARWAPGRELTNAYGPTEVTIAATWSRPLVPTSEPPTIGTPLLNTQVYLLDADLRPVSPGHTGEIFVAGPRSRARLPQPARTERGTLCRQPVRAARQQALPHRRPRPPGREWRPALPRPRRPPDQDPRQQDRTGRDPARPGPTPECAASRRHHPRHHCQQTTGWLCGGTGVFRRRPA